MRISDKKRQELYKAFSEPITQLRIKLSREETATGRIDGKSADDKLYKLEHEIWASVCKTLGIEKP